MLNAWVDDSGKRSNQRSETRYQRIDKNCIPKRGTDIPEASDTKGNPHYAKGDLPIGLFPNLLLPLQFCHSTFRLSSCNSVNMR